MKTWAALLLAPFVVGGFCLFWLAPIVGLITAAGR